jgi:hypothetical protein
MHKFCPDTKETQSDEESASYFLLTDVFNIANNKSGIAKIDMVSTP